MSSPIDQFNIIKLIPINIAGFDISFTNSAMFMIIASLICVLIPYFILKMQKGLLPSRSVAFFTYIYDFVKGLVTQHTKQQNYIPLIMSLFLFIFTSNLLGIIPGFFTTTSHIIITLCLALTVYIAIVGIGIKKHRWRIFSIFLPSDVPLYIAPIIVPVEIVQFIAKPISLSIRLFANMVAGHIVLKIFAGFAIAILTASYYVAPLALVLVFVNVFLIAFELMVAFLQAYIFTVLICIYMGDLLQLH